MHGPGLYHIFIQLGSAPLTTPSMPGLPIHTYMGTLPVGNQCVNTRSFQPLSSFGMCRSSINLIGKVVPNLNICNFDWVLSH
jgi:hypothetical protein